MKLTGRKIIMVHRFLTDYNSEDYCPSSEIFDFDYMNNYLKPHNIRLIDVANMKLNIKSVLYGKKQRNVFEIKNAIVESCLKNSVLEIPSFFKLNDIMGDPMPNVLKDVYIEYTLGDCEDCVFSKKYVENEPIVIDHVNHNSDFHSKNTSFDERAEDSNLIDEIILNIKFSRKLVEYSGELIKTLALPKDLVINIIHLRNEDDAIPFWGGINKINNYKQVLEDKYISLIHKYIQPNSYNIILSMNTNNRVVDFLKENNYTHIFTDKNSIKGRELNAIVDMLLAMNCNGTFIGNLNPENHHGSSFSDVLYTIYKNKFKHVKNVLIDVDKIFNDEIIC